MVKWGLITFGVGMILMVLDIVMAQKKKGGMTPTDKQRIIGIFWTSIVAAAIVAGLFYLAPSGK